MEYYIINKSTPPSEYTTILLHSEDLLSKAIYSFETVNHPLLTFYTINSHSYYLLHYQFHSYKLPTKFPMSVQGQVGTFYRRKPTANWPRQPQNKPRTQKSKARHHLIGLDWIRLDAIHHHIGFSNIGFYQKISIKRKCFMVPETTHGDRKNWI